MGYYLLVLKKYAEFQGRARRKEYWMFTLFNVIIVIILMILSAVIHSGFLSGFLGFIGFIYYLVVLIPSLAVFVRRLHDTGHSGWWFFIGFIPIIGFIVLIIFLVQDSQPGGNQYGPYPKEIQPAQPSIPA